MRKSKGLQGVVLFFPTTAGVGPDIRISKRSPMDYFLRPIFKFSFMCTYKGQEKVSDPLELDLQILGSLLAWMLRTELGSSGRTVSTLNH